MNNVRRMVCWLLALMCVCALPALGLAEEAAGDEEARVFAEADFQTPTENVAGKAWLALSIDAFEQEMNGRTFQMYNYIMQESNGIGFAIETITVCAFGEGEPRAQTFTAEQLTEAGMQPQLEPNGSFQVMGGFPKDDYDRLGIEVTGTDANGEALVFTDWTEFTGEAE